MGNFVNDKDLIPDEVLEINLHRGSYQFTDNQWGCLSQGFATINTPVLMENSGFDKVVGAVIAIQRIDKAMSSGLVHKNKAARLKSRLTKMKNGMN